MDQQQVTQPIPEPVIPSQPVEKPKSKLPLLIIGISLVAFLSAFGGFYVAKQLVASKTTISPTPIPSPAEALAQEGTVNWKTYTNSAYNYSLKYPSSLTVGESGMGGGNIQKSATIALYEDNKKNV